MIIVPTPSKPTALCVPTVIEYDGTDALELVIIDTTRHKEASMEFPVASATAFSVTSKAIVLGLQPGQYDYILQYKDVVYGRGIMQVGLTAKENASYEQQHEVYVYENTED